MTSEVDDLLFLLSDDPADETPASAAPSHPLASAPLLPRSEPAPKSATVKWNPKWDSIGRITQENCVNGTGPIEKLPKDALHRKNGGDAKPAGRGGERKRGGSPSVISFGKHSGKLIVDVREEDPGYIAWCIREDVQGMREKCAKLGITEDDFE